MTFDLSYRTFSVNCCLTSRLMMRYPRLILTGCQYSNLTGMLPPVAGSSADGVTQTLQVCVQGSIDQQPDSVVVPMVRRRTTHDKVGVRKAAVQALEALVRLEPNTIEMVSVNQCVCIKYKYTYVHNTSLCP